MLFQQFAFKSFGYVEFRAGLSELASQPEAASFIKILLVETGRNVVADFEEYHLPHPTLFFLNAGQYHHLDEACAGTALCYNRDFYVVAVAAPALAGPVASHPFLALGGRVLAALVWGYHEPGRGLAHGLASPDGAE